ncbi:hypothetical protein C5O80_33675 [Burkholderia sp. SRS-46]|nr:hypothetical protein C5O80_33675 [Burkholderia sp. SRS-46]
MRRFLGVFTFAIVGFISVVVWATIDARICSNFAPFCAPRPGECGGGIDACGATLHSTISLFAYVFGPPIIFSAFGFILFAHRRRPQIVFGCLTIAVAAHWLLTFLCVRILRI